MTPHESTANIPDDVLLVFVGHSDDAEDEAKIVCDLTAEIQRELNRLLEVIVDNKPSCSTIQLWEWNYDAKPEVGGQDNVIHPYLERADIAVFIFKERVGTVTWQELNQCRDKSPKRIPVIAIFPEFSPDQSRMNDIETVDNWRDLLNKKRELTADWTNTASRSVAPTEDYQDNGHLRTIVLEQIKRVLGGIVKPAPLAGGSPDTDRVSQLEKRTNSFLDRLTSVRLYDSNIVSAYRDQLRSEIRVEFPAGVSDGDFLTHTGYLREGKLTGAGVLLFTRRPETEFPTAIIRCTRYHGTTKVAPRKRSDITGPIHEQSIQAYDFASADTESVELPRRGSLASSTEYLYPMICVREIIGNAIAHRDYEDNQRMTYVRIYSDRIEVRSPGTWGTAKLTPESGEVPLQNLESDSVSRNFQLARGISSINNMEVEGSGIATALKDCDTTGAPEPTVAERNGYIVVKIFPKANWTEQLRKVSREASGEARSESPTVFISYSHKDEIWKDRLRPHLAVLEQLGQITVWDDRQIATGAAWYPEIEQAIAQAAVTVCLISADYLASDFVTKEEIPYLLERRKRDGMMIIPVLLRSSPWEDIQWIRESQMLPRDGKSVAGDFKDNWDEVFADVALHISRALEEPDYEPPAPPAPDWSPPEKLDIHRLPVTGAELFGRQKELALLDEAWEASDTNIVSLVAWGGVGKSTLTNKWLEQMAADNYRGARRVFGWSFFSQGTGERVTSADQFIAVALEWFGDEDPTKGSPWDKGQRLADLVRQEMTLLVLHGLESLQSDLDYERGKIKDPTLATLVSELARGNSGLCVISTREAVADLAPFRETTREESLEQISVAAGRALLRIGGVHGTDAELESATLDFGTHALALNLLAAYLREIPGHQISNAAEIPDLDIPVEQGKHPRRVIAAFAQRFGDGPEVGLLRVLGLFDRPAEGEAVAAVRATPAIPNLTQHIQGLSEADWLRLLERLRRTGLIAPESEHRPDTLDAHPLVREHFGQQLREEHSDAWREGNNRLYEYYKQAAPELPDTLEEMAPLFAAVAHGCAAGRHQEALDDVYKSRIQRGNAFFCSRQLGAVGAELATLTGFFDPPWRRPVNRLTAGEKGYVLNQAGFDLRALGRLTEAVDPMRSALDGNIAREDWRFSAIVAGNLSQLYLTIGNLVQALEFGEQSFELAGKSRDTFQQISNRTTWADALHQAGSKERAEALFLEAEAMNKERLPEQPFLYSLQGFLYCDLLLEKGRDQEVQERASLTIETASRNHLLLDIALDQLSLGRARLAEAQEQGTSNFSKAAEHLDRAVDGLRQAGQLDYLPRGLLARAALNRVRGDFERAQRDLDEAMSIAERGGMRLHQADAHLEYARLYVAMGEKTEAREHWAKAKRMVEKMGYHRRDGAVAELEKQLEES